MPLSDYAWPTSLVDNVTPGELPDTLAVYDRLKKLILGTALRGPVVAPSTAATALKDVADYVCTGTADQVTLKAATDASPVGSTVWFLPGTYNLSAPWVYKPFRAYRGLGPSWGDQTVIKAANGSSTNFQATGGHSGVVVPESWDTNATTPSGPVDFRDLMIHGNKPNNGTGQHHGLILYGEYWCMVQRMRFFDCKRSGLCRTTLAKNGSATMAAGISDNRFEDIFCASNGEHGAFKSATGGVIHTDEVWTGTNLFFDNGLSGFWDDRADGFRGHDFHFSNNGQHGLYVLDTGFAFKLEGLYVESFGTTAAAGIPYFGVRIKCLNGEPPILSNANIRTLDPAGTASFVCLAIEGGDTDAHVYLNNVHLMGAGTARGHGANYNVSSGKLTVHETNLGTTGFTAGQDKELIGAGTAAFDPPRVLSGTTTWDPASIADGGTATTTVTVTGARVGDPAQASLSTLTTAGAVTVSARVTGNDTVSVTIRNSSGGPVDPASGTLRAMVWKS